MNHHAEKRNRSNSDAGDEALLSTTPSSPPSPPHALDGSQYHNVIEEQVYAEQPPTAEEQKPWRIFHPDSGMPRDTSPDEPTISVGTR